MDIIKAKPVSFAERNAAFNVDFSQPDTPRGQPPTNVDKAKYVLCSNLMRIPADSSTNTNAAYIIIGTSDLALPTARVNVLSVSSTTQFIVTSSSTLFNPNPSFPDGTSQLNKVVRKGVGALKDTNGNDITITSWTRTAANRYTMVTSAALSDITPSSKLFFGDITGSLKSSALLPPQQELIVEKEPTDLIYGSNGINGNMAAGAAGRIVFTKINRIRID